MDPRVKKLKFRAWRRGFRELDLIMGGFAVTMLDCLGEDDLDAFERLLEAPDQEVYGWILGREAPPPSHDTPVLALIRKTHAISAP
jgi:antitoxin CptB